MKKFIHLLAIASVLLTGCYKNEIEELKKEMASLENTKIATLQEQVQNVTASIGTLEALSSELKEYINKLTEASSKLQGEIDAVNAKLNEVETSLQAQIDGTKTEIVNRLETAKSELERQLADINTVLSNLEQKSADVEKKITDLKKYADDNYAEKDWVEGTFATLEAQNALIDEVEAIKANIVTLTKSIEQVETNVKEMVGEKLDELSGRLDVQLKAAINEVKNGYQNAISVAKSELQIAYNAAIRAAIQSSEITIKNYIDSSLVAGYYKASAAEAQIAVFNALLGNVPGGSSLQGQIDTLQIDLDNAKVEIIDAYENLIRQALKDSVGTITKKMTEEVATLNGKINGLENRATQVENYYNDLANRVGTLEGQMTTALLNLNTLKTDLSKLDTAYNKFIEGYDKTNLNAIVEGLKQRIRNDSTLIKKQNTDIAALNDSIRDLRNGVNTLKQLDTAIQNAQSQIDSLKDFIEGYGKGTEYPTLQELINNINTKIQACASQESLTNLDTLVNGNESTGFVGLVDKVSNLTTSLGTIQTNISNIQDFIGTHGAETTLTTLLSALRNDIDKCLADQKTLGSNIKNLTNRIKELEENCQKINELTRRITEAEGNIGNILKFLSGMPADTTVAKWLNAIQKQIGELGTAGQAAQSTIQGRIDAINLLLFGKDGSKENPKSGSVFYKLDSLNNVLVGKYFQSISYVPKIQSGAAKFNYDSQKEKYKADFDFIVRPAALAPTLATLGNQNDDYCKLKWISTPDTKAIVGETAFAEQTFAGDASGLLTVTVYVPTGDLFQTLDAGASAALFVNAPKGNGSPAMDFTSKFIPISMPSENVYVTPSSLTFEADGGELSVEKTPHNRSWSLNSKPSWITAYTQDVPKFNFTAESYNGTMDRTGTIVLSFKSDIILVDVVQKGRGQHFTSIKNGEEELLDAEGKVVKDIQLAASGEQSSVVSVLTSDGGKNWSVNRVNTATWLKIDENKISSDGQLTVSATKNESTVDSRQTTFTLVSSTGTTKTITVKQNANGQTFEAIYLDGVKMSAEDKVELSYTGTPSRLLTVVTSNKLNNWSYEIPEDDTWLNITRQEGEDKMTISASEYTGTDDERTSTITLKSSTDVELQIQVVQSKRAEQTFEAIYLDGRMMTDDDKVYFVAAGTSSNSHIIGVVTSDKKNDWSYEIPEDATWLHVERNDGEGQMTVYADQYNTTSANRETTITLKPSTGSNTKVIDVVQYKKGLQELTFKNGKQTIDPKNDIIIIPKQGGTIQIEVTGNPAGRDWTVFRGTAGDWLYFEKIENSDNVKVWANVNKSSDKTPREGTLVFYSNTGKEYTLKFKQEYDNEEISLNEQKIYISVNGLRYKIDNGDWADIPEDGFRRSINYEKGDRSWELTYNGTISWKDDGYDPKEEHTGPHETHSTEGGTELNYVITRANANTSNTKKTCTITFTSSNLAHTATLEVEQQAYVALTGVTLNKTEIVVPKNSSYELKATINPNDASVSTITWSSNNNKVTVDNNGKVTVNNDIETATITCTVKDINNVEKKATCTVRTPYFTKATSITSGATYIITNTSNNKNFKAFKPTANWNEYSTGKQDVTANNEMIIKDNDNLNNCKVVFTGSASAGYSMKFAFETSDYYLNLKEGKFERDDESYAHTISYSNSVWNIYFDRSTDYNLRYIDGNKGPESSYFYSQKSNDHYSLLIWEYHGVTTD